MLWWLAAASIVTFVGTLVAVPLLVARIPEDYFAHRKRQAHPWRIERPVLGPLVRVAKNLLGIVFVAAGIVMLVAPGQGVLTILVGMMLIDFPGKYRLERRVAGARPVRRVIDWLRRRTGRPPLRFGPDDEPETDGPQRAPRRLKAVFRPDLFEPFPRVRDAAAFEALWARSPHAVLANMAHAAYHRSDAVEALMARLGAERTEVLRTLAFLAVWPGREILVFRGSATFGDSVVNSWFLRGDFEGDRVHRGFRRRLEGLWRLVRPRLPDPGRSPRPGVYVTGHSLGGALAILAGARYPFDEIVTFGAPRVGVGLQRVLKCPHVRYANGRDLVCTVPPAFLGYRHDGDARRVTDPDGPSLRYDHAIVYYAEILEMEAAQSV